MSDENANANAQANAPVFRMQKMYIKDLSFENPNAPEVFINRSNDPKVEVNLGLKNKKMENDHWEVALSVTANVTNKEDGKALFMIEVEHAGVFMLKNIPEEHMPLVLAVECPTLMFPFTRQIISQVSVDGGFIPFLLEPVNFHAVYESARKRQEAGQGAQ